DGGETWKDLESGVRGNLFGVATAGRNDVLVVGEQGSIIHSKDGGQTWEIQPTITNASLFSIAYRGGSNVWVAGRGGAILRRVDPIATVNLPVSKIPPMLKGGSSKTENVPDPNDIPMATPPNKKPEKP
ncbi:MAG TPA: YCF48-related protein, partial [Pyrinomonadaceae bacterium]|nr:YCF48-related protein [Pyrinomonadaceae bacterium]